MPDVAAVSDPVPRSSRAHLASPDHPRSPARRRSWRLVSGSVLVALTLSLPAPLLAAPADCPHPDGSAVLHHAELDPDGEILSLEQRPVGSDDTRCVLPTETADEALAVAVSILHQAADGQPIEASQLTGTDPIRTRVQVTDRTAEPRTVTAPAPYDAHQTTRHLGIPQRVEITVSYPRGWDVHAPDESRTSIRVEDDRVVAATSGIVFAGLLEDALTLEVTAVPGRGTPTVTATATALDHLTAQSLPDEFLDRDTPAVVGALLALLTDGTGELTDGARELADGVAELDSGVGELAGAAAEIATGATELHGGVRGLADGADELSGGTTQLAEGAHELAGGAGTLRAGADELTAGVAGAADGADALAGGAQELTDGLGAAADGFDPLQQGAQELAAGARQLADGLDIGDNLDPPDALADLDPQELLTTITTIADTIASVGDDLQTLLTTLPEEHHEALGVAIGVLGALSDGLVELAAGVGDGLATLLEAADGLAQAADGADELATGAAQLADGLARFDGALAQLADGAGALAGGTQELATGLTQLADGSGQFAAGVGEFGGGVQELADGAGELAGGTRALADGTRGLVDGTGGLTEGTGALADGTAVLADGTATLTEGTDALADGALALPDALQEVTATTDRASAQAALTAALLDASAKRAAPGGELPSATTHLVHTGEQPPASTTVLLVAAVAAAVVGVVATGMIMRRRRDAVR